MSDEKLLEEALESLEEAGCQFFACDGPRARPKPMVTCFVCATVAKLRRRLGRPVRTAEDRGQRGARQEQYARDLARATGKR